MKKQNMRRWKFPFQAILLLLALALLGAGPEDTGVEETGSGDGSSGRNREEQTEELIYESPVFIGDGEAYRPAPEMEKEGKRYHLVSSELQKAVKEGRSKLVSSWISFALEGEWEPPEKAEILVADEVAGTKKEYTVPILEVREKSREWSDDFSFSVTVSGYGSEIFRLGDMEISGETPLDQYGPELLLYLGLPAEYYQVEEVEWLGEPYEKEGVLCRDAQARGRKLMRNMEVRYGGQVELPPAEGLKYYCVYREILEVEESGEETEAAPKEERATQNTERVVQEETETTSETAGNDSGTLAEQFLRWLTQHLTIVRVGVVFLAGIFFTVLLLVLAGRKKKRDEE